MVSQYSSPAVYHKYLTATRLFISFNFISPLDSGFKATILQSKYFQAALRLAWFYFNKIAYACSRNCVFELIILKIKINIWRPTRHNSSRRTLSILPIALIYQQVQAVTSRLSKFSALLNSSFNLGATIRFHVNPFLSKFARLFGTFSTFLNVYKFVSRQFELIVSYNKTFQRAESFRCK